MHFAPNCQSGTWKTTGGVKDTQVVFSGEIAHTATGYAYCPTGTQVTGCGYRLVSYKKNGNSPDAVYPVTTENGYTGCFIKTGGYAQASFKVWAACR